MTEKKQKSPGYDRQLIKQEHGVETRLYQGGKLEDTLYSTSKGGSQGDFDTSDRSHCTVKRTRGMFSHIIEQDVYSTIPHVSIRNTLGPNGGWGTVITMRLNNEQKKLSQAVVYKKDGVSTEVGVGKKPTEGEAMQHAVATLKALGIECHSAEGGAPTVPAFNFDDMKSLSTQLVR